MLWWSVTYRIRELLMVIHLCTKSMQRGTFCVCSVDKLHASRDDMAMNDVFWVVSFEPSHSGSVRSKMRFMVSVCCCRLPKDVGK